MKKHTGFRIMNLQRLPILMLILIFIAGCTTLREKQISDCSMIGSAVSAASYAIIGEYGDDIPKDLSHDFLKVVEKEIPSEYFSVLQKYSLDIRPKGNYYLLLVRNPESRAILVFDYSCTAEPDGMVCLEPERYDLSNLDSYDTCKTAQ